MKDQEKEIVNKNKIKFRDNTTKTVMKTNRLTK